MKRNGKVPVVLSNVPTQVTLLGTGHRRNEPAAPFCRNLTLEAHITLMPLMPLATICDLNTRRRQNNTGK